MSVWRLLLRTCSVRHWSILRLEIIWCTSSTASYSRRGCLICTSPALFCFPLVFVFLRLSSFPHYVTRWVLQEMSSLVFRSNIPSRPNIASLNVCLSVCPSTKCFSDLNDICYVGGGRWVLYEGMPYDPIRGQGQAQGHRGPESCENGRFQSLISSADKHVIKRLRWIVILQLDSMYILSGRFFIFILVRHHVTFKLPPSWNLQMTTSLDQVVRILG